MTFAERLRALRCSRALTQAELAALLGTTQHEVSRWETGAVRPRPATQRRLCAALGVELVTLLGNPFDRQESL